MSWIRFKCSSLAALACRVSVPGAACTVHWPQFMVTVPRVPDHSACVTRGGVCVLPGPGGRCPWRGPTWACSPIRAVWRRSRAMYRAGSAVWMTAWAVCGLGIAAADQDESGGQRGRGIEAEHAEPGPGLEGVRLVAEAEDSIGGV